MEQLNYSKTKNDLKGPKGLPLVGNIFDFDMSKIHLLYEQWADEFGSLYNINILGKKITVSTDPETNAYVLKHRPTKFRRLQKMADVIEEVGVNGVFSAEGETWKKHRKVTQKALSNKNIRSFFPTILRISERLTNYWNKIEGIENYAIDQDFEKITVDVTTLLAFGYDLNSLENDVDEIRVHINNIFPKVNSRINSPIPLWKYYKTKSDKEFDESINYLKNVLGDIIETTQQKMAEGSDLHENPTNFLEAMIASEDKEDPFTNDEIFGNVYTMLLAGEDTTSNSLSWITYLLAANPTIKEKIQNEIDEVLKGEKLSSFQQLNDFPYLSSVIKETLRLKPVSPNLYMQALEDVVVSDVFFPKGSMIITQLSHAQRRDKYFAEASTFAPERWTEREETKGCPYHKNHKPEAMKPFGGGARLCPGMFLSETEMKVFVIALFQDFDVTLDVAPEEVKELFAFTMSPDNLKVSIKKRVLQKEKNVNTESVFQ
ncbi:cytochrome P450 [Flammeovirga sp. OC4]|uniref:cytochrome P450 n=1 Tax=Flammeovirga sp. OC4 TaxID=1382345 RepID=UPI0005C6740D|nr:cytochrome P450 [Flammeovirga sp. OC4]